MFYSKREVSDPTIKSNLKSSSTFFDLDCVSFSIYIYLFLTKWMIFMKYQFLSNPTLIKFILRRSIDLYKYFIINQVIQLPITKTIMNNITK